MVKRAGGSLLLSIQIDRKSHQPVSTQLCVALREMILEGAFRAGERLPASRTLARELGLSRTTIIEVFDRLVAEGLVESHTGSGTFVSQVLGTIRPKAPPPDVASVVRIAPTLSRLMAQAVNRFGDRQRLPHLPRAFTTALPAFDVFPMAQWARLSAKYLRGGRDDIMGYGDPYGSPQLRRALAAHLRANRGIGYLTRTLSEVAVARDADQRQVTASPIGRFALSPVDANGLVPGFGGVEPKLIDAGAQVLDQVLESRMAALTARMPRARAAVV